MKTAGSVWLSPQVLKDSNKWKIYESAGELGWVYSRILFDETEIMSFDTSLMTELKPQMY